MDFQFHQLFVRICPGMYLIETSWAMLLSRFPNSLPEHSTEDPPCTGQQDGHDTCPAMIPCRKLYTRLAVGSYAGLAALWYALLQLPPSEIACFGNIQAATALKPVIPAHKNRRLCSSVRFHSAIALREILLVGYATSRSRPRSIAIRLSCWARSVNHGAHTDNA